MMMALSITLIIIIARRKQRDKNGTINGVLSRANPGDDAHKNNYRDDSGEPPDNIIRLVKK